MGALNSFLICVFLVFTSVSRAELQIVDRVIAVVNSEIVAESDLKSFNKRLEKEALINDLLLFGKTVGELRKDRVEQLNYLVREKLLEAEIKRLNLSVTAERVEQEIKEIAKRNNVDKGSFLSALKAQGMAVAEYQEFIKNRIEAQSLIESEISAKIRISDEDVMAAYSRKNPESSTAVHEYTLSHIFFNAKKGGPEYAKARGEAVFTKLKKGENFEELAQANSEDKNFSNDGLLGTFKAGEFSKEFESAVANLQIGDFSQVVRSKDGYHILRVLQKKLVEDPKFEAQKEKFRRELFEKAFTTHFKNWIEQKKEESFVRINL